MSGVFNFLNDLSRFWGFLFTVAHITKPTEAPPLLTKPSYSTLPHAFKVNSPVINPCVEK